MNGREKNGCNDKVKVFPASSEVKLGDRLENTGERKGEVQGETFNVLRIFLEACTFKLTKKDEEIINLTKGETSIFLTVLSVQH